ncbi:hypothetical protein B9Z65_6072 [Elsinoe australis]|uniref:Gfd2/YDR514C-like C-terminal domain-containing protein n=1 Tax=Elsinoe australis TaxID=40998 RepID=A0A2P8A7M0_9PEZI|nr:hypothetical protein B9Z65_6072 [Elsinoe australis]
MSRASAAADAAAVLKRSAEDLQRPANWAYYHDLSYFGLAPREHVEKIGLQPRWAFPVDSILDIDLDQPAPYPFADDVIFLCIDVERDCSGEHNLTEIGWSTLDTRDLRNTPPGDRGSGWHRFIKTDHVRITEYLHPGTNCARWCRAKSLANGHNFGFGLTKYKTRDEAIRYVKGKFDNLRVDRPASGPTHVPRSLPRPPNRKIVFVAWDKSMEEKTVDELGLGWLGRCIDLYDVQTFPAAKFFAQSVFPSQDRRNKVGLKKFTERIGIVTSLVRGVTNMKDGSVRRDPPIDLLHNGGNDSAFEMQALLAGICLNNAQCDLLERDGWLSVQLPHHHYHSQTTANWALSKQHIQDQRRRQ